MKTGYIDNIAGSLGLHAILPASILVELIYPLKNRPIAKRIPTPSGKNSGFEDASICGSITLV